MINRCLTLTDDSRQNRFRHDVVHIRDRAGSHNQEFRLLWDLPTPQGLGGRFRIFVRSAKGTCDIYSASRN
jgi:hypothetical protein